MNDPRLQALLDQIEMILLILERPVVQRQLVAFAVIFIISWLLPAPLGDLLKRLLAYRAAANRRRAEAGLPVARWRERFLRWARGLQQLLFPIVGLIASQVAIGYFRGQQWPAGLLDRLVILFWLVLGYRLVSGLLFALMEPDGATYYESRFVRPLFAILMAVTFGIGLAATFPIFEITLLQVMETPITLRSIAVAVVLLYVFLAVARITSDILRNVVLPRAQADPAVSNTVTVISRYAIITIGVLSAVSVLGFDLSALTIIGGGLSVGIGFGLQELVANFISGILLLFEQTLRPGDIIEVEGKQGTVNQLRMRATVLRTFDNVDVLVPNKTLLTSTVSTYTNVSRVVRRTLRVGVSYNSNPTQVRDILQSIVDKHGLVLDNPAPGVFFVGFGESSLDFELIVWIDDPIRGNQIVSDLYFMIFKEFSKHQIEIPFPQRDLHLRSAVPLEAHGREDDQRTPRQAEEREPGDRQAEEQPAEDRQPKEPKRPQLVPAEKPRLP